MWNGEEAKFRTEPEGQETKEAICKETAVPAARVKVAVLTGGPHGGKSTARQSVTELAAEMGWQVK